MASQNQLTNDERVAVLGAGSWGTALAALVAGYFQEALLWGHDPERIRCISDARENTAYLPGIPLPDNLQPEADLQAIVSQTNCYVVVVPSHAFRNTLERLKQQRDAIDLADNEISLVWGCKGFDPHTGELLSKVAIDIFGSDACLGVVSGPSFAAETIKKFPTALTVASNQADKTESLAKWFRSPTTRVYTSNDLVGVQLGGAIKNVMAIAAGIGDGLGYGANARAALITRGLAELNRLCAALGGRPETIMGLTGVGDLILTCTDNQSRNRRFGMGLGQGKSVAQVKAEIGQEIEGINTARELYEKSKDLGLSMPITEQVYRIIYQQQDPAQAVADLLQRDPKTENG